ncbi:hypothetical protein KUL72_29655 [Bradyrhizobium arachidis]|nr:hypothetical protein KUL72_29655 [Bradyrhizobium arachidis]
MERRLTGIVARKGARAKAWMRCLLCELLSRFNDGPRTEQNANRFTSDNAASWVTLGRHRFATTIHLCELARITMPQATRRRARTWIAGQDLQHCDLEFTSMTSHVLDLSPHRWCSGKSFLTDLFKQIGARLTSAGGLQDSGGNVGADAGVIRWDAHANLIQDCAQKRDRANVQHWEISLIPSRMIMRICWTATQVHLIA